jgi:hypothetical protein
MSIHSIRNAAARPSDWKLELFAHISGSEEFVVQLILEMTDLVNASTIEGDAREKLKQAITDISVEGLMRAFEHLKKIRDSANQALPELNRKQLYEDFSRVLWHAYKDLMQRAVKLMEPKLGFLFNTDAELEKGLSEWQQDRPRLGAALGPYLRGKRSEWQNDFASFRNDYLEHKKDGTDPKIFADRYTPERAEMLFENVWRTIADILASLVTMHLPSCVKLAEIPPERRNPVQPYRFEIFLVAPSTDLS